MKERLDKILVLRGLVQSRERAKALIMGKKVFVDGHPVTKAGTPVDTESRIDLRGNDLPYVSRGGLKLKGALDYFSVNIEGAVTLDVGASTGGFTDCMLQGGAKKVYAVDVGYGQLSWKLRNDPRVIVLERTNIRHLTKEAIPEEMDFVTIDVSFISLLKVIPAALQFLKRGGKILALVKPQFEVGKSEVEKGGVIRDSEKRENAVNRIVDQIKSMGLYVEGPFESTLRGQKGNIEYFVLING